MGCRRNLSLPAGCGRGLERIVAAAEPSLHCNVQPCGPGKDQLTFAGGLSARSYRGSGSCSFTDGRRHGTAGNDGTKARDQLHDLAGRHFRPWRREDVEFDGGREERDPAGCRRFQFGGTHRAERRKTDAGCQGLSPRFQSKIIFDSRMAASPFRLFARSRAAQKVPATIWLRTRNNRSCHGIAPAPSRGEEGSCDEIHSGNCDRCGAGRAGPGG
jgi:hypothetical protein